MNAIPPTQTSQGIAARSSAGNRSSKTEVKSMKKAAVDVATKMGTIRGSNEEENFCWLGCSSKSIFLPQTQ